MSGKNVLVFAPYGSWRIHHELDAVVGTALRLRGANLHALLCDGLFRDCPIAGKPPEPDICRACAAGGAALFSGYQIPSTQMRSLLTPADYAAAEEWSQSLPVSALPSARFEGVALGEFVRSSVHTYFMVGELDYSTDRMAEVNRGFLYNGALIVRAFAAMVRVFPPDHAICYNGVHAYYRIFYELCKANRIPVLIHERGLVDDTFLFLANHSQGDHSARIEAWKPWEGLPLDEGECRRVKEYFIGRERGSNTNTEPIYGFATGAREARRMLRIPEGRKIVGLFTSSDWEVGISRSIFRMTFSSQAEWIRETVRHCAEQGAFLVIRHHPNNAREGTLCAAFLKSMMELNEEFPDTVRVIMPSERITSYGLLWSLDLAVTYFTTMGAETAIRGIPTLCLAESMYREMGSGYVTRKEDYGEAIRRGLTRGRAQGLAELRAAYRFANYLYFACNLRFTSYGIANVHTGQVRFRDAQDLLPGHDSALDKVCDHILAGVPLLAPEPGRLIRGAGPEDAFLEGEWAHLEAAKADARRPDPPAREPSVGVLRAARRPDAARAAAWDRGLLRSRLRPAVVRDASVPDRKGTPERLRSLARDVARLGTEFAYLGSDRALPDESVLGASADFLSDPQHARFACVSWGGWVCDRDGDIQMAVLHGKTAPAWEDARKAAPSLDDTDALLAFTVARTAWLAERLEEWAREAERGQPVAGSIYAACFADSRCAARQAVPALALHPDLEGEDMVEEELGFLFEMAGQLGKAERHYRMALQRNPADRSFLERYTGVLMRMGREKEAERLAAGDGKASADTSWSAAAPARPSLRDALLQRINLPGALPPAPPFATEAPPAMPAPRDYAEIARHVESVKGWLLAGQEKFLFDKVRSLPDGAVVIEMGANKGRSTCAMAFACVGTRKKIYSIDTFSGNDGVMGRDGDFETEWQGNLKRLGLDRYAVPLKGFTFDVLPHRELFPAPHFVFIDASHEYWDVLADFKGIYDYVVEGGWIAFHDVEASWPGPWRVWEDYGRHLLTDHEQVATLSCGRKAVGKEFGRAPGARLGFSFAEAFTREMENAHTPASPLCQALRLSLAGRRGTPQEAQALRQAEVRIAEAPEEDFRRHLVNMMSVKDAQIDGLARLWSGLALISEGKGQEAYVHLSEALRCSYPLPGDRIEAYLQLIRGTLPGPFPHLPESGPRAADFRAFVRAGDIVLEFRSGRGETLRGLDCAGKLGIEPDRENRKRAIVEFGIDGAEAAADLPDACADLVLIHEGLAAEPSPLAALRALRPKLKSGGRIACVLRDSGDSACLYAWNPATLANLLRAAGFAPRGEAERGPQGELRLLAEKI